MAFSDASAPTLLKRKPRDAQTGNARGKSGAPAIARAGGGHGPDVLSIDPGLNRLYVAAERGTLVVFDLDRLGLVAVDREHVGERAHSVAVDPLSHRLFFPLQVGPNGGPVLRIARPR